MKEKTFQEKTFTPDKYPARIKILKKENNSPSFYPHHWHEHIELLYIVDKKCSVSIGGETAEASKGDLVIINGNELHSTTSDDDAVVCCIQISQSLFSDIDFDNIFFKSHIKNDNVVNELSKKILYESENTTSVSDLRIKGYTYLLMAHLIKNYTLQNEEISSKKSQLIKINSVLQYISAHYHTHITTAELAKEFFLSEYYFCHFFKAETGMTPVSYINKFRIEKSTVYIKTTNENLTQIALKVGFEDSNYFSKIFKKHKGMSPREYKKRYKE